MTFPPDDSSFEFTVSLRMVDEDDEGEENGEGEGEENGEREGEESGEREGEESGEGEGEREGEREGEGEGEREDTVRIENTHQNININNNDNNNDSNTAESDEEIESAVLDIYPIDTTDFSKELVKDLKIALREKGLSLSGSKADMVDRLQDNQQSENTLNARLRDDAIREMKELKNNQKIIPDKTVKKKLHTENSENSVDEKTKIMRPQGEPPKQERYWSYSPSKAGAAASDDEWTVDLIVELVKKSDDQCVSPVPFVE
jgi:SAP domain